MGIEFRIENGPIVLNLNELFESGEGAQVVGGATGLGLPPVDTRWLTGAGDGSRYQGRRVLSRDIDLPIAIYAASREAMQEKVDELARAFDGKFTLHMIDSDTEDEWTVEAVRVGGGDVIFGGPEAETIGEQELMTTVTIRTESPFWRSVVERSVVGTEGNIAVTNEGSAEALPVITVSGKASTISVRTAGAAQGLTLQGGGWEDRTFVIDSEALRITDDNGVSAYSQLLSVPAFPILASGANTVEVTKTDPSVDVVRNYYPDPACSDASPKWEQWNASHITIGRFSGGLLGTYRMEASLDVMHLGRQGIEYLPNASGTRGIRFSDYSFLSEGPVTVAAYVRALGLGTQEFAGWGRMGRVRIGLCWKNGNADITTNYGPWVLTTDNQANDSIAHSTASAPAGADSVSLIVEFTGFAPGYYPPTGGANYWALPDQPGYADLQSPPYSRRRSREGGKLIVDGLILHAANDAQQPEPWFSGDSSDSLYTYAWEGTANASTSTKTPVTGPVEDLDVEITFHEREWVRL